MKTRKWPSLLLPTVIAVFFFSSCQDWGQMDPPAGNQVYPRLAQVAGYPFESLDEAEYELVANENGNEPKIVNDDFVGKALNVNDGYLRITNALTTVNLQLGASVTFWVKQSEINADGALFSFTNEANDDIFSMTGNGSVNFKYSNTTVQPESTTSRAVSADVLVPDEWHYMAVVINTTGYTIYINGELALEYTTTDEEFSTVAEFLQSASYFNLGHGGSAPLKDTYFKNIKLYRNIITAKEVSVPKLDPVDIYEFPPLNTVGYYMLNNSFENSLNPEQSGELITMEAQTDISKFEEDADRGTVWHQQEGWAGNANGWAYTRFDNPLKGVALTDGGFTLSMWIKPPWINWWDQIFVLNDGTSKFWINALGYVGYNGAGGWFDCHNNNNANEMTPGEWTMFTLIVTADEFTVYYNNEVKFTSSDNAGYAGDLTTYQPILNMFATASDFFFGYESWWKAAPAYIDDLFMISRPITDKEVKSLYQDTKKVNGSVENPSYIPETAVGYYKLDNTFENAKNPAQSGEFITVEAQATPSGFEDDATRGIVWHQQEGWAGNANGWAYTRFDNPMRGAKLSENGFTLSMWINPPWINWWDQIFVLNDGTSKFWFNALGYVGYNGAGGWFDCHNNNNTNEMTAGQWTMFTLVVTADEFVVYYNDEVKFTNTENGGYNSGDLTNFQPILTMFTTANDFFLGYESWWKAAPALVDDILLCTSPLSESQVKKLYKGTKK